MTDPKLTQFKLLCFDVYGTLIDWEGGIYQRIEPLIKKANKPWSKREALIAFHEVETNIQCQNPTHLYSTILAETYYALAKRLDLPEDAELEQASKTFGNSVGSWVPFPDTIDALARLSKSYRLVVLSNVDRSSFTHTQKVLEQNFKFDLILTAQDIGSYKPNLNNFEYMVKAAKDTFNIDKHEILMTGVSLYHDHKPANSVGISSVWVAREGSTLPFLPDVNYLWKFPTLGDMAAAVEKELAAA